MPLSGHSVGTLSGNELTCNSSGNTQSQSSQLAEPLWTNPGVKRGISVRKLISNKKKERKKAQAGNELSNILPGVFARGEKATTCVDISALVCQCDCVWACR